MKPLHVSSTHFCRKFSVLVSVLLLLLTAVANAEDPGLPMTVAPGAKLVELYATDAFFEGPVWHHKSQKLFFTLHKGKTQQVLRLDAPGKVFVWMDESKGIGGMFPAPEDRLFATESIGHRLVNFAVAADGPVDLKVLHHNKSWNQPNDLCRTLRGDIYFTDPDFQKRKTSAVYLWSKGKVAKVIDDMPVPNGIIASLDGKTLYVADSHKKHWRSYPINQDGSVDKGRVFFNPDTDNDASPDGMSIDEHGNLYFTGRGGVWVVTPKGKPLGLIKTPMFASNCTLGGKNNKMLFIVGSGKVLSIQLQVRSAPFAGALDRR